MSILLTLHILYTGTPEVFRGCRKRLRTSIAGGAYKSEIRMSV